MANAFESGARKMIPAVLVYPRRAGKFLMIHRNARPGDYHLGKWNGLGGKLEADESAREAARRELREESGLDLPEGAFTFLGSLHFPNFKAHKGEDWMAFVFLAEVPEEMEPVAPGTEDDSTSASVNEGELHWVAQDEVPGLPLWAGDRHFIRHVIEGRRFQGTIWYRGEEVLRHEIETETMPSRS